MLIVKMDDVDGVENRGFGFIWYRGVAIVGYLWAWRVSWSPWFVRLESVRPCGGTGTIERNTQ